MKPRETIGTRDEYYAKLVELLSRDSEGDQNEALANLCNEALLSHVSLSKEQALDIKERATNLYHSGECRPLLSLVPGIIAPTGIMTPEAGIWRPPITEPTLDAEYNVTGYQASILRECGIISPDERVLAADIYKADVGNEFAGRQSFVFLTEHRLLLVGSPIPPPDFVGAAYRLYYDDWESRPYLDFVDMIWLDKIASVEYKWDFWRKSIIMQYETKYMKEKMHTFFGPYFFKARLPSTFSVHEGLITIYLTPFTIVPADPKMRVAELVKRILEAKSNLKGRCLDAERRASRPKPRALIMAPDEYYAKLSEMLSNDATGTYDVALESLSDSALSSHVALSPEQAIDIRIQAEKLSRSGNSRPLLFLVPRVSASTGRLVPETGFWTAPVTEPTPESEYNIRGHEVRVLRESGVLSPDERVLAADTCDVEIGGHYPPEQSHIYLTDQRLLLVGPMAAPNELINVAHQLYYEDWESRPCLDFMDMIWLDRIESVKYSWTIVMKYRTKYFKGRPDEVHRLCVSRGRPSPMPFVREGVIDIYLTPQKLVSVDPKERMAELVRRIQDAKAALGVPQL